MPLFTTLLAMPDQFERLLAQVPTDHLDWEPTNWAGIPSERFSARGHLCHLLDIEVLGYQVRFRRTLRKACRSSPPSMVISWRWTMITPGRIPPRSSTGFAPPACRPSNG
ncbi:hypothetical protein ACSZN0_07470 [Aeromonas caviae]